MMKFVFAIILFIHGFIHLAGFLKTWNLAEVKELTGKTIFPLSGGLSKTAGVLWLSTFLLFALSAFTYLMKEDWWWMPASAGLLISQVLIIIYWPDAKFGTAINVIILLMCILGFGSWNFNKMIESELKLFRAADTNSNETVTEEKIAALPHVVQKWLKRSNVIGKEMIKTVSLRQLGQMRTSPEGSWWPFTAWQFFTVEKPGFLWKADVDANPFLYMTGRDKYYNGKGHMLIKVMSLIPVVDEKGEELDQGTVLRFMAETVWFPTSALNRYIKWEELDSLSARATMTYNGVKASGIFRFNSMGDVTGFEAMRYFYRKEGSTFEKWVIAIDRDGYREFEGVRVPAKSSVIWKLNTGDYRWLDLEVVEMRYNL